MKIVIQRSWVVFTAACSLFTLSQFYKTSIAVITPQLMNDLALDARGISLMSAVFFYAFALAQIPMGIYLDRTGPRRTMGLLSLVAVCGVLIFAGSNSLAMSTVGRALLGIGMACNLMGSFKLLTLWFSPLKFATLSTLIVSIGSLGNITSTTPLVLLVGWLGWRWIFVLFGVMTLITTIIFFLVVRDKPSETPYGVGPGQKSKSSPGSMANLVLLIRNANYWIISLAGFSRFGIFFAFQGLWAGPYLMEAMGFSPVHTGNMILILNIGYIFGGPLFGFLSDTLFDTRKWIVVVGLASTCLLLATLALLKPGTHPGILALIFFLFGIFGSAGMVMYSQIKELMPADMSGTAMAGVNFFAFVGAAVFLHGMGSLMQYLYPGAAFSREGFQVAYLVCASCLAVVSFLYLFTTDTHGKNC